MEEQERVEERVEEQIETQEQATEIPQAKVSDAEKEANLKAKLQIIEELKALINTEEIGGKTFTEFRSLQERWRNIGIVPAAQASGLWSSYNLHIENFYNHVKINKELRDMDLKHNLEEKTKLCNEAEALTSDENIGEAFKKLQSLHARWKESGPVAKEEKEAIWERFKAATAIINDKYHKYVDIMQERYEQALAAKQELCQKADALAQKVYTTVKEWQTATEQLIKLQEEWKTVGEVAVKERTRIYKKFRQSCDLFFNNKKEYYQNTADEQAKNLELKRALCEKVEAIQNSEEWKSATEAILQIQQEWKEIGAVSQKHSQKIWNRFRAACDTFFNRKSEHFKSIDNEQTINLEKKQNIIEQLSQITLSDDTALDLERIKELQSQWNSIGHVPMKNKEILNEQYKKVVNKLYSQLNISEQEKEIERFKNKVKKFDGDKDKNAYKIVNEREKLVAQIRQLESDIKVLENNMGFFNSSKKADSLIQGIVKNINNSKERLSLLKTKLKELDKII